MNYFSLLAQPQSLTIDESALKERYQSQAAENHPDKGGEEKTFQNINLAYDTLKRRDLRTKHLIEVEGFLVESRGTVSNEVMDFFMPISELIQNIEAHQKTLAKAQSALNKAMLAQKTMQLQEHVETFINQIENCETVLFSKSLNLQKISSENLENYQILARNLTFLIKWKAELREKYASLFTL